MNPIVLPALAGLGLLFLASKGSAKPTTSSPTTTPKPGSSPTGGNTSFQLRIAQALARGDADELLRIANELQAAGFIAEAEALRTSALNLKNLGALGSTTAPAPGPVTSPGLPVITPSPAIPNPPPAVVVPAPPASIPPVIAPAVVPLPAGTSVTPEQTQRLARAQAMAMNLRNTSRYKENTELVKQFQAGEGLVADGKYGPKSGLALAQLGIVPPRPRYWSSKTVKVDKTQWANAMLAFAATDPARAADWRAASNVANDPVK